MNRGLGLFALVALVLVGAAVAVLGFRVSPQPASSAAPKVKALNADARRTLREEPRELARDSVTRAAERMTLRVRNISCAGVATGSGFAIDEHTIITNRHVLQGAAVLELNTWDGASLDADVNEALTGRLVDIGVTRVSAELPAIAELGSDPREGDRVTAVGYPLGGPLTLSAGRVTGYLDGRTLPAEVAFPAKVLELSVRIKHGNSGGPLLDRRGRVVGVIFAGQPGATAEDFMKVAYAIPLSSVRELTALGGQQAVVPCA
jgi:S1-C subfamily serine protease